jgi:hypothetical protein
MLQQVKGHFATQTGSATQGVNDTLFRSVLICMLLMLVHTHYAPLLLFCKLYHVLSCSSINHVTCSDALLQTMSRALMLFCKLCHVQQNHFDKCNTSQPAFQYQFCLVKLLHSSFDLCFLFCACHSMCRKHRLNMCLEQKIDTRTVLTT